MKRKLKYNAHIWNTDQFHVIIRSLKFYFASDKQPNDIIKPLLRCTWTKESRLLS